jgi:hypothetical protein
MRSRRQIARAVRLRPHPLGRFTVRMAHGFASCAGKPVYHGLHSECVSTRLPARSFASRCQFRTEIEVHPPSRSRKAMPKVDAGVPMKALRRQADA